MVKLYFININVTLEPIYDFLIQKIKSFEYWHELHMEDDSSGKSFIVKTTEENITSLPNGLKNLLPSDRLTILCFENANQKRLVKTFMPFDESYLDEYHLAYVRRIFRKSEEVRNPNV